MGFQLVADKTSAGFATVTHTIQRCYSDIRYMFVAGFVAVVAYFAATMIFASLLLLALGYSIYLLLASIQPFHNPRARSSAERLYAASLNRCMDHTKTLCICFMLLIFGTIGLGLHFGSSAVGSALVLSSTLHQGVQLLPFTPTFAYPPAGDSIGEYSEQPSATMDADAEQPSATMDADAETATTEEKKKTKQKTKKRSKQKQRQPQQTKRKGRKKFSVPQYHAKSKDPR